MRGPRYNKITRENNYLVVDVSTPKHRQALMFIDESDWNTLRKLTQSRVSAFLSSPANYCLYARVKYGEKTAYVHRLVCHHHGLHVDHRNGNGLDNRRCNLRAATASENHRNRRIRRDSRSGVKGINVNAYGKYIAYIGHHGRLITIGQFDSLFDATKAREKAVKMYHGNFAGTGTTQQETTR